MIISLQSYVHRGEHLLRRWMRNPKWHSSLRAVAYVLAGFCFSAASLGNCCLPLAMALVCGCSGWAILLTAAGGSVGYLVFWGSTGYIGIFWIFTALAAVLLMGEHRLSRKSPLLLPAAVGFLVAASGLLFQVILQDQTPIPIYLLRVVLGASSAVLFARAFQGRNPILDWLVSGLLVLSLAQIVPIPYLGLGYVAAGFIVGSGAFPMAAFAGLALDLAQVTPVPMTAVMTLGYLVRFLPRYPKSLAATAPAVVYLGVMSLAGAWDIHPLPGLLIGGVMGVWLPVPGKFAHRRGETGVAQVRLELAAGVLTQTEVLLTEVEAAPVDEDALVERAAEQACSNCAYRKSCRDSKRLRQMPSVILHKPLLSTEELPVLCRKPGRVLAELHRCQEQLRSIRADRERQKEYRAAVVQQYRFLSVFLQDLADQLPRRADASRNHFYPEVTVYGNRSEQDNGDRCLRFAGVGRKYYVMLCDGMGQGLGAVAEGKSAASLLHRMLSAGYPAEYALRSLNSLCALRDRAGVVSVDLAEVMLDSGKVSLYKWGAAPSYLTTKYGAERIGAVSPPPGLSVLEQERVEKISLRRGEWLVMVSDGVGQREALRCCMENGDCSPAELATGILNSRQTAEKDDDATVVILRLSPI